MNWQDIPGWFDWEDWMRAQIDRLPSGSKYVEVGCFLGRSTAATAKVIRESGKQIQLLAVDAFDAGLFKNEPELVKLVGTTGDFSGKFEQNMRDCGALDVIELWKMQSISAVYRHQKEELMETADVVFLDGDHSFEGLFDDICAWWNVLKPGGIMAGHDIRTYQSVTDAVKKASGPECANVPYRVLESQNIWVMQKPTG